MPDEIKKESVQDFATLYDQDISGWISSEYEKRKLIKMTFDRQVYLNFLNLLGQQDIKIDTEQKELNLVRQKNMYKWRESFITNQIMPRYRIVHSKFISAKPCFTVKPNSLDQVDIAAANTGKFAVQTWWKNQKCNKKVRNGYRYVLIGGCAFIHTYWNKDVEVDFKQFKVKGEVESEIVSPLNIFPDGMSNEDFEQTNNLIYAYIEDIRIARKIWNKPELIPTGDMFVSPWQRQIEQLLSAKDKEQVTETKNSILMLKYYEFPNVLHPKGRYVVIAGKELVYDSENEEEEKDKGLPDGGWVKLDYIPIPGQFFPKDMIADLIPLNHQYNKSQSMIARWRNLTVIPKILIPESCDVEEDAWTDEPGEKIRYFAMPGMSEPKVVQPPPMPNWLFSWNQLIIQDMNDVAMTHDPSFGKYPKRLTSGKAISALQEQDVGSLSDPFACMEDSFGTWGTQVLVTMAERYEDARLAEIVSSNNKLEAIKAFKGTDLRNNTRVICELEQGLPQSKMARIQMATDLWSMKFIPNTDEGRRIGLRIMDIPEFMALEQQDESHALWENGEFLKGKDVVVNKFDQHLVHFNIHNEQRKKAAALGMSKQILDKLVAHMEEHNKIFSEFMSKMATGGQGGEQPPETV